MISMLLAGIAFAGCLTKPFFFPPLEQFGVSTTTAATGQGTASCNTLTLPYYTQSQVPVAAPSRGAVGYTVQGGNIYGPNVRRLSRSP